MKVVALQFLTVSKHPVLYVPSLISPRATLEMLELALPHRLLINNFHHFLHCRDSLLKRIKLH